MQAMTFQEAGKALLDAINNERSGFVARVDVLPGQAAAAESAAVLRRIMARRHSTKARLNYTQAAVVGTDAGELGQMAAERRAMLSELLVADVLDAVKAPGLAVQPLVAHKPQPGLDVRVAGKAFDVKAAGQMSVLWSHQGARGKFADDRNVNFNNGCHEAYQAEAAFSGYICVYLYVVNEVPVAADIFLVGLDGMGELHASTITNQFVDDLRYFKVALPFPDSRHSDGYATRLASIKSAYAEATREAA